MRIIFTALGGYGHAFPLIPLAVAARDAGHDVSFATAASFLPNIERAGITGLRAGITPQEAFMEELNQVEGDPRGLPPDALHQITGRVFGEILPRAVVADLEQVLAGRPDLVIYEMMNAGGAFAAKLAGIPSAGHNFGRVAEYDAGKEIRERVRATAAEFGVEGELETAFGAPVFDICPESVQSREFLATAKRIPLRPTGWSTPGDLPVGIAGRDRSRPLAYLTLGTQYGNTTVLTEAITGLAALDLDVLVATGPTVEVELLGDVPDNVRLERWVPQSELLPHLDLVVHHGGSGTTMGAFGAGLPQLFLPQGADQLANAEASVKAGVAAQLVDDELTAEAVTEKARALLTDTAVRDATRALAKEVAAMPMPAEVVTTLPGYFQQGSRVR
ncbi:glycosyl transferase [Amycolatopsis coloradensis]|uniref:Glycosyl transferase n=1 Tax=Amycolatopsis coloradensis TaxID=76021 RepID=A0A1R0KUX0_9PSEU|nr:glycosyltransferase [Amycolatopsis coloradensis]OLZ52430.1 glycosyl transferase [Amycolatopsis coloradensis]